LTAYRELFATRPRHPVNRPQIFNLGPTWGQSAATLVQPQARDWRNDCFLAGCGQLKFWCRGP
jgi:hypothetical protein